MKIQTFEERQMARDRGISMLVAGKSGVGKTSLVNDLKDPVLLIDMEAGDLSVTNKQCDTIKVRTVEELFDLAVIIGGSNPAIVDPKEWFSQAHYDRVNDAVGGREKFLGRYKTIMFDSLTEMGRIFLKWAEKQPENNVNGKLNLRGCYGDLARHGLRLLHHIKHTSDINIVFVSILEEVLDDFNRKSYSLQIEGSKIAKELAGILDEVFTMDFKKSEKSGEMMRVFYTSADNEFSYPAKDRSGSLRPLEFANLEKIFAKINGVNNDKS